MSLATYIALFRSTKDRAGKSLPMSSLVTPFQAAGCDAFRTYQRAGNIVFRAPDQAAPALERKVPLLFLRSYGFKPILFIRTADEIATLIRTNPFPRATADPETLHLGFFACPPSPDRAAVLERTTAGGAFALRGRDLFFHKPRGSMSQMSYYYFETRLQASCTFRTWRTVRKLADMAAALDRPV